MSETKTNTITTDIAELAGMGVRPDSYTYGIDTIGMSFWTPDGSHALATYYRRHAIDERGDYDPAGNGMPGNGFDPDLYELADLDVDVHGSGELPEDIQPIDPKEVLGQLAALVADAAARRAEAEEREGEELDSRGRFHAAVLRESVCPAISDEED